MSLRAMAGVRLGAREEGLEGAVEWLRRHSL